MILRCLKYSAEIVHLSLRLQNWYARKIWIFYIFNMFTVMVFTRIYVMAAFCFNLTLLHYIYMQLPCVHYQYAVFMRICLFWLEGQQHVSSLVIYSDISTILQFLMWQNRLYCWSFWGFKNWYWIFMELGWILMMLISFFLSFLIRCSSWWQNPWCVRVECWTSIKVLWGARLSCTGSCF